MLLCTDAHLRSVWWLGWILVSSNDVMGENGGQYFSLYEDFEEVEVNSSAKI